MLVAFHYVIPMGICEYECIPFTHHLSPVSSRSENSTMDAPTLPQDVTCDEGQKSLGVEEERDVAASSQTFVDEFLEDFTSQALPESAEDSSNESGEEKEEVTTKDVYELIADFRMQVLYLSCCLMSLCLFWCDHMQVRVNTEM